MHSPNRIFTCSLADWLCETKEWKDQPAGNYWPRGEGIKRQ